MTNDIDKNIDDTSTLDINVSEILEQIERVGLYEFDLHVESEERSDEEGDVHYIIGSLFYEDDKGQVDQTPPERIATIYSSTVPTYDGLDVADYFVMASDVLPELILKLSDLERSVAELDNKLAAMKFFIGELYRISVELSGDDEAIVAKWEPLLKLADIDCSAFDMFISELPQLDEG